MAAPIVQWYNGQNTVQQVNWEVGNVDAGSSSNETEFLIWNNRGGAQAVSDMINCSITTKDHEGGNQGELITDTWIEVKNTTRGDTTFTPIGGDTTHAIGNGPGSTTISGKINDGEVGGTGKDCHTAVVLRATVPPTATGGVFNFLLRVAYQYV